uniref:Uncharacterized protein n=1 Tax=Arundo donax TaxID=35708 RepID=A0A0A9CUS6_ARUDO
MAIPSVHGSQIVINFHKHIKYWQNAIIIEQVKRITVSLLGRTHYLYR